MPGFFVPRGLYGSKTNCLHRSEVGNRAEKGSLVNKLLSTAWLSLGPLQRRQTPHKEGRIASLRAGSRLTRNPGIHLNERVSLQRHRGALF
jgi:hypothetical protein